MVTRSPKASFNKVCYYYQKIPQDSLDSLMLFFRHLLVCLVDISNLLCGLGMDGESFFSLHQELVDGRDVGVDGAPKGGEEGVKMLLDAVFNRGLDGLLCCPPVSR